MVHVASYTRPARSAPRRAHAQDYTAAAAASEARQELNALLAESHVRVRELEETLAQAQVVQRATAAAAAAAERRKGVQSVAVRPGNLPTGNRIMGRLLAAERSSAALVPFRDISGTILSERSSKISAFLTRRCYTAATPSAARRTTQ
jgi:hypothetical protein